MAMTERPHGTDASDAQAKIGSGAAAAQLPRAGTASTASPIASSHSASDGVFASAKRRPAAAAAHSPPPEAHVPTPKSIGKVRLLLGTRKGGDDGGGRRRRCCDCHLHADRSKAAAEARRVLREDEPGADADGAAVGRRERRRFARVRVGAAGEEHRRVVADAADADDDADDADGGTVDFGGVHEPRPKRAQARVEEEPHREQRRALGDGRVDRLGVRRFALLVDAARAKEPRARVADERNVERVGDTHALAAGVAAEHGGEEQARTDNRTLPMAVDPILGIVQQRRGEARREHESSAAQRRGSLDAWIFVCGERVCHNRR